VFWSALDVAGDRVDEHQAGLDSAAPFLRRRIASALPWKRSPELRFRYDPSLLLGSRTLSLLHELEPEDAEGNDGPQE